MDIPGGGVGFFDSGIGGLTVLKSCLNVCGGLPSIIMGTTNARLTETCRPKRSANTPGMPSGFSASSA